jgi:transcriptional regulator with XRE-family HTH domain
MPKTTTAGRLGVTDKDPNTSFAHKDVLKREFGQRLHRLLVQKQMSQTELARAAAKFTPDKSFGRDLVSSYISGRYLPNPVNLAAMARALGVESDDLLPQSNNLPRRGESTPPLDIRVLGEDRASLRVNQVVSLSVALKVAQLINDDTKKS